MHTRTLRSVLLIAFLATAASPAAAQGRRGSLYDPDRGPFGLVSNKTARRPGDLVTVVISESQDISNEESSDLSKSTDLSYRLTDFNLAPDAFNVLPSVAANSSDAFTGSATYQKRGNFTARLTAIVVDSMPNGNLVISGRREIRIDKEIKIIEFTGIVRRYDILPDNTIQSERVANARVDYSGSGPLTNHTNRRGFGGRIHAALSWLWPF